MDALREKVCGFDGKIGFVGVVFEGGYGEGVNPVQRGGFFIAESVAGTTGGDAGNHEQACKPCDEGF